jgi:predicted MPP superfamily phosphohydrolase
MSSIGWLHLSDLHRGLDSQDWLWDNVEDLVFSDLKELSHHCGPWDLVLFTGDLVQKGSAEEYAKLDINLEKLMNRLRDLGRDPILLAVPGNHDLLRPSAMASQARALRDWGNDQELRDHFWKVPESEYRTFIDGLFASYTEWWERWRTTHPFLSGDVFTPGLLPGDFSLSLERRGIKLGVVGLNVSFLHLGDVGPGKIGLHTKQAMEVCDGSIASWTKQHDLCLLMTHHPPDWLDAESQTHLNQINPPGRFVFHLFGHMHQSRSLLQKAPGTAPKWALQGPSLFGLEKLANGKSRRHGYNASRVELRDRRRLWRLWPRKADKHNQGHDHIVADTGETLQDGWGTAVEDLGESPLPTPPLPPARLSEWAFVFDRTAQWATLTKACLDKKSNLAFLLHGSGRQGLSFFIERIYRFFDEEACSHRVVNVPLRYSVTPALTSEEWGLHLRRSANIKGTTYEVLTEITRQSPVLFILTHNNGPLHELNDEEKNALFDFLGRYLPEQIQKAQLDHGVRLLVPVEHPPAGRLFSPPLVRATRKALERAKKQGIKPEKLVELSLPPWEEVRDEIENKYPDVDETTLGECSEAHLDVRDHHGAEFGLLVARLEAILRR